MTRYDEASELKQLVDNLKGSGAWRSHVKITVELTGPLKGDKQAAKMVAGIAKENDILHNLFRDSLVKLAEKRFARAKELARDEMILIFGMTEVQKIKREATSDNITPADEQPADD